MRLPLVVVGDALLDVDIDGTATRLSPEAPVPVVDTNRQWQRPGGAGLAAVLAARTGHRVVFVTALGNDESGIRLASLLESRVEVVALPYEGETVCKTRIQANGHPLLRLDSGVGQPVDGPLPPRAAEVIASAGAILVSDYGRGVTNLPAVREALAARTGDIPVVWDPHPRGPAPVSGAALVTPNAAEADRELGRTCDDNRRAARLCRHWNVRAAAVTVGARGAVLSTASDGRSVDIVPSVRGVSGANPDTCGAGDTFAAAVTSALYDGVELQEAVQHAVDTASRFVAEGGAVGVSTCAGSVASAGSAITTDCTRDAVELAEHVRRTGGRVVATGGCFDLLHPGHVGLLRQARLMGDVLIVCLNSDASVRRAKGPSRPVVSQADRARVLCELSSVDAVLVFDEDTPEDAVAVLRPDIWVKGGDYTETDLPEAEVVAHFGGKTVIVPTVQGYSTSSMVDGIHASTVSAV
ncbi:bifunctional heptose 7-phosphate kinase/heptose 1-phosphate adenyltransferase [Rhodococcus fascians]|nr:bifunctional heptose 7-phosphate kinase/heptose 1-phosphate adenyltransferase [Rhodococcus fascians]